WIWLTKRFSSPVRVVNSGTSDSPSGRYFCDRSKRRPYPPRHKGSVCRRGDAPSPSRVDDADRTQPHDGTVGFPHSRAVPDSLTGREILPSLSPDHRRSRGQAGTVAAAVAESERPRGAVGAIGQGRVSVSADPVWGSVAPPCADTVCRAFSS